MTITEVLRRKVCFILVMAAVWCAATPQQVVYVRHMPLSELIPTRWDDKERAALITAAKDGKLTAEQSKQAWQLARNKHELVIVRPDLWKGILTQIANNSDGEGYFPQKDMPEFPYKPYQLVQVPNGTVLMVDLLDSSEAFNRVPAELSRPWSRWSLWLLILAVLVYIAIPWPPKASGNVYAYRRLNSVILPDWLGYFLVAAFTALPLFVVSADSNFSGVMRDTSWIKICAWGLLAAIPGLSILFISWWYSCTYIELHDDKLAMHAPMKSFQISYDQIRSIEYFEMTSPRWLKRATLLLMYGSLFTMTAIYIMLSQPHAAARITMADGSSKTLLIEYLPRYQQMLKQVQQKSSCELKGFEL